MMEPQPASHDRQPTVAPAVTPELPAGFSFDQEVESTSLPKLLNLFHALDSQIRVQIIDLLSQRDHYVFELVELLGSSQPLVSQHLRVLKNSGLISSSRVGRQVTYHLAEREVLQLISTARSILESIDKHRE